MSQKFCKDCVHCQREQCYSPHQGQDMNIVTGELGSRNNSTCYYQREPSPFIAVLAHILGGQKLCGTGARFFEPKVKP
jgi:hypothetical protein